MKKDIEKFKDLLERIIQIEKENKVLKPTIKKILESHKKELIKLYMED